LLLFQRLQRLLVERLLLLERLHERAQHSLHTGGIRGSYRSLHLLRELKEVLRRQDHELLLLLCWRCCCRLIAGCWKHPQGR
jgi:hypothetical protein